MQKKSSTISLKEFKKMRQTWCDQLANIEIQQINHWRKLKRLDLAYKNADKNKYVVMTLRDKKMRYKFKTAKNIVLRFHCFGLEKPAQELRFFFCF